MTAAATMPIPRRCFSTPPSETGQMDRHFISPSHRTRQRIHASSQVFSLLGMKGKLGTEPAETLAPRWSVQDRKAPVLFPGPDLVVGKHIHQQVVRNGAQEPSCSAACRPSRPGPGKFPKDAGCFGGAGPVGVDPVNFGGHDGLQLRNKFLSLLSYQAVSNNKERKIFFN